MARTKRELKEGLVLLRQKGDFFISDAERVIYEDLLLSLSKKAGLEILAFLLEDKRVILLLHGDGISSFMQGLNSSFKRARNKLRSGDKIERFEARNLNLSELNITLNLLSREGARINVSFTPQETLTKTLKFKTKGEEMNLVALSMSAHKDMLYHQAGLPDFAFANIIASEVQECERTLSVVFTNEALPKLVVLLGQNSNLTIGEGYVGYVPAALQNYPFSLSQVGEENILCIDEDAPHFEGDGERLFEEDGEKSEFLSKIVEVMSNYNAQMPATTQMIKEIKQNDLLISKELNVNIDGERKTLIKGFCVVDKKKLNALDDSVLADFARRGYLEFIYAHLRSLKHLSDLAGRILNND